MEIDAVATALAGRNVRARAAAAILAAWAFAGCAHAGGHGGRGGRGARSTPPPAPVPTVAAVPSTVHPTLTIAGIIAPYQNVQITGSLSEPVKTVRVDEGDRVTAGETLATLDTSDLDANLASQLSLVRSDQQRVSETRYQANLAFGQSPEATRQARAALVQAQQTLAQAQSDLKRDGQLVSSGYISQQQYQQQETTANNDASAVRSAQAALSSAVTSQSVNGDPQAGLQASTIASAQSAAVSAAAQAQQIRAQIARADIVSPVDGVVVNRNLNPGEYPGSRTVFTIQALDRVYAELNASSADVFAIRRGAPVRIAAGDDRSGRAYAGSVVAVLGQVAPGSTNFTVKALLANPGDRLQAGVPVTGTIALASVSGVGIPTTAFLDETHGTIMVARDGKAVAANVRDLGSSGSTSIVSGIPAGTSVVSDGQLGLANGQLLASAAAAPDAGASPDPNASPGARRHRRRGADDAGSRQVGDR